jgi:hypothetical protein
MESEKTNRTLILLSAAMSAAAGVIHFWLAPIHWFHAPAHGIFFIVIGVAQVMWASLVLRQPSTRLYYVGAIMSGWLIVLYAVTRWLPSPFGHGPEAADLLGMTCKLCEAVSMIPPIILIFQGLILNSGRKAAWQSVGSIVVFSIVAGLTTYTVAKASEPYLPGLAAPRGEIHDEHDSPEEHHHEETAPEHEHDDDH